jgi:hypothetical protein
MLGQFSPTPCMHPMEADGTMVTLTLKLLCRTSADANGAAVAAKQKTSALTMSFHPFNQG